LNIHIPDRPRHHRNDRSEWITQASGINSLDTFNIRFPGQYYDAETEMDGQGSGIPTVSRPTRLRSYTLIGYHGDFSALQGPLGILFRGFVSSGPTFAFVFVLLGDQSRSTPVWKGLRSATGSKNGKPPACHR